MTTTRTPFGSLAARGYVGAHIGERCEDCQSGPARLIYANHSYYVLCDCCSGRCNHEHDPYDSI